MLIVANLIFLFSCSEKNKTAKAEFPTVKIHNWYYFSNEGFQKIDLPQNAPEVFEKPWTESGRITSAASLVNLENKNPEFMYPGDEKPENWEIFKCLDSDVLELYNQAWTEVTTTTD